MGLGLGCGLAENVQATTPGLGLGRDPSGGSLKSGMGWASDPMWRAPIRFVGHALLIFLINC
ncbi:hypothetical protein Hanom_Chr03g00225551 [Helianthus anomalus]